MTNSTVRVGIAGIGNCAASLVQGVAYYTAHPDDTIGLAHPLLGGWSVAEIVFSAAFDVADTKVGTDLSQAIVEPPNSAPEPDVTVAATGVVVQPGAVLDGVGPEYAKRITVADGATHDRHAALERVVAHLAETDTQVLVSYMPVGSVQASEFYAEAAAEAGAAFVNAAPIPLARSPKWRRRFEEAGTVLVGDDVKSQFGATIVHRSLVQLMSDRGCRLDRTYQLNVGGNMDFLNMLQQERLEEKRRSKTEAVTAVADHPMDPADVRIGPSDYVAWLGDRKVAFIRCEGRNFAGAEFTVDVRLEVADSPNSAGIVIDAVRAARLGAVRGCVGVLDAPSAWLMKAPPHQQPDGDARRSFEEFLSGLIGADPG